MAHSFVSISTPFTLIPGTNFIPNHFHQMGIRSTGKYYHSCEFRTTTKMKSRKLSTRALGSDVSEDTDDMYDDMFEKYGKVVFTRNDQKPPSAEIDDDAESLSFAVEMSKVANDVKASEIKLLFVKPLVYWTRFFIIATAFSRPQIDAIRTRMADLAEQKFGKIPNGDSQPKSWTLLDFGDVVVHIFLPDQREFYNLEEFYGNATPIELPFESEKPFQR